MKERWLDAYSALFGKKRFAKFKKLLFMAGARGLGILNYKSPYQSGEELFLQKFLKGYDQVYSVVLDIGAKKGDFASRVIRSSKNLNVISLEPNPAAASALQKIFRTSTIDTQRSQKEQEHNLENRHCTTTRKRMEAGTQVYTAKYSPRSITRKAFPPSALSSLQSTSKSKKLTATYAF